MMIFFSRQIISQHEKTHFNDPAYSDTTNQEVPPLNSSTASFLQQHEQHHQEQHHQEQQQHDHQLQQPHQDEDHPHTTPNGFQNTTTSPQQQQQVSLPNVKEEDSKSDIDLETPCGSPKQKNSSRRNKWGNLSYADLITQAIKSSPEQRLTLSQIYDWVVTNVPYFSDKGDSASSSGWKVRKRSAFLNTF